MSKKQTGEAKIRFGRFEMRVPGTRWQRISLGMALMVGGVLGFLPILGFWMLPLGLLLLSIEFHPVRRFRRRLEVWYGRKKASPKRKRGPGD